MIEQGEEDIRSQAPSHPVRHGIKVKVRYTKVRKWKIPEARSTRYKLRKAGKKQAKLRLGIPN